jgi:hypothetical protein
MPVRDEHDEKKLSWAAQCNAKAMASDTTIVKKSFQ